MKLNHECVRDLLLAVEKHATLENDLEHDEILALPELQIYNDDMIIYTVQKLDEAGFINGRTDFIYDGKLLIAITSLTYDGHSFLDAIRDKTVWVKTKEKASMLSSVSLPLLCDIGTSVLKEKLGLS